MNLQEILAQISRLREDLHKLISEKEDNLDPEVIALSKLLDQILNQYYDMIKKK